MHQFTSAITNIANGGGTLLPFPLPNFPPNTPWCLATAPNTQPLPPTPPPSVNSTLARQVWAGPLAGGDVVVLLLNAGNGTVPITVYWDDVGLSAGATVRWTDLWTGRTGSGKNGTITRQVGEHDSAVLRLSPIK